MNGHKVVACVWIVAAIVSAAAFNVSAAELVARWDFGTEETTRLIAHGGVHRDVPGPRPPEFPDFDADNVAVKFDGSGAHYVFNEAPANGPFAFKNGDAITLEAWVDMTDSKNGENLYVIGKGRTYDAGFPHENQNWALRIRELQGSGHISFLFMTPHEANAKKDANSHRWTSTAGFAPGSGWHRVAVSYKFGEPDSIRAWLGDDPSAGR